MNKEVTFNELSQFTDNFLKVSDSRNCDVDILTKEMRDIYDYKILIPKITEFIEKFKDSKYIGKLSITDNIKLIPTYGINIHANRLKDKVGDTVGWYIDTRKWAKNTYNMLLDFAPKLTYNEAVYFIDYFFRKYSEEHIAEKLNMGRNTFRNQIKQSCIVKIWLEFGDIIEKTLEK